MQTKNLFIVLIAFLFTISIFPLGVQALTYRADVNDGEWSQYNAGLANSYYQTDAGQTTYNRAFESTFSLTVNDSCSNGWCFETTGTVGTLATSTIQVQQGSHSAKIHSTNSGTALVFAKTEYVGDSNVGFYYYGDTIGGGGSASYGYVNDHNTYTAVGSISQNSAWAYASFVVPAGNNRIAFYGAGGGSGNGDFYIDNITVTRNNVGTFRVNDVPQFCSTTEACSNAISDFPSKDLGETYFVAEYVAGATCTYAIAGGGAGVMTEGLNGMYYVAFDQYVDVNDYKDVNIVAQCTKVPYATKSWKANAKVFLFNVATGGGFENTILLNQTNSGGCQNGWCAIEQSSDPAGITSTNYALGGSPIAGFSAFDGQNALYFHSVNNDAVTAFAQSQYVGGMTVYLHYLYQEISSGATATYGYVNDNNSYTAVGTFPHNAGWQTIAYAVPNGGNRIAFFGDSTPNRNIEMYLDHVDASGFKKASTMTATNDLTSNYGTKNTTYNFYATYLNGSGNPIVNSTCTFSVNNVPQGMTYNSVTHRYETSYAFSTNGLYAITVGCANSTFTDGNSSYNVTIAPTIAQTLTIEPISNIASVSLSPVVPIATFTLNGNSGDVVFDAYSQQSAYPVNYIINNTDTSKDKQYFIYSSTDGATWIFDDTMTFGATNSTGVQKIWNGTNYTFSFSDTFSVAGVKKYYKLIYQSVPKYWETIGGSSDWLNQNTPTATTLSNKSYDLFSDSNYTNIQSRTILPYQNLVSSDLTVGYELQFTAYGSAGVNILVGSRVGSTDTVTTVPVTTTATRFSVPISPSARDAFLLIKSTNISSTQVYVTDYALVPRSYFMGQLEIKNPDYTDLQAILRNGASTQYVIEGQPVRVQTSAYDSTGTLSSLELQTILGGAIVKDQVINLTSSAGKTFNWNQLVDGAIDLNGIGGELTTTGALRTITYKAILYNNANEAVSQQYKTVSVLQFPYFPNDFKLNADVLNSKLGTNPTLRVGIRDTVPSNFLGLDFAFFDSSHSLANPNYSETVYANDLGCTDLQNCTKELTFDKYVWDSNDAFTVQVTALLTTENKNYTDSYANVSKHVVVTPSGYLQVQMIQYMERHQNAVPHTPYNSTERVPLMLGVTDDTGKNLGDTISPYFTLNVNSSDLTTKYYPDAYSYDETSGTTIWMWNQYLYDDSGNLLDQNDIVKFKGVLADKRQTQQASNGFGFVNRCTLYPADLVGNGADYVADWWNGSVGSDIFNWKINQDSNGWVAQFVNIYGSITGSLMLNGCVGYPQKIVTFGNGDSNITIDNTFDLTQHADNRQALYCGQKYDNNSSIDQLGDEFGCVLLIHEDLQQIDNVHIQIGNDNSDYAVTNSNKQYIDTTITSNDIMFSDTGQLIREWNQKGYFGQSPTNSPTVEDFIYNSFIDFITPDLSKEQVKEQYHFTELIGGNSNYNFQSDFNNRAYNKAIFFKVSGLSVVNAYDYLTSDQQATFNTKNFLSYAKANNLPLYQKKLRITIYNNSLGSQPSVIEMTSPIVINKAPTTPQLVKDANGGTRNVNVPEILPFHVISTMSSANSTINQRLISNLQFRYIIKAHPLTPTGASGLQGVSKWITDVLYGKDSSGNSVGLFNAPVAFIANPLNIILIVIVIAFALVFTLMIRNVAPVFRR